VADERARTHPTVGHRRLGAGTARRAAPQSARDRRPSLRQRSPVVTSQVPINRWPLADAILDLIIHRAHRIDFKVPHCADASSRVKAPLHDRPSADYPRGSQRLPTRATPWTPWTISRRLTGTTLMQFHSHRRTDSGDPHPGPAGRVTLLCGFYSGLISLVIIFDRNGD
jgi:hypothetical protein